MELMTGKAWKRLDAAEKVQRGEFTMTEAALVVGVSTRQMRRLCRRIEKLGRRGAQHGNAGRAALNRTSPVILDKVLELRRGKYVGFNDSHFAEMLSEREGIELGRATVRRLLREADIASPRKRRPRKYRRRRERMAQAGLMVLWDGSRDDWLEERGPMLCLQGGIDDATGELLPGARFLEQESSAGYLNVLLEMCRQKGIPWSIYMDRHGSLKRWDDYWTKSEELAGVQRPTQVGRALEQLGIEPIFALSPQAKGRVERLWGTLQDRLKSELRLTGAKTLAEANQVLEKYRPAFNRRFARRAAEFVPAWRSAQGVDLERVCSFHYFAVVQNDNTVRWQRNILDLPPKEGRQSWAKCPVDLIHGIDGTVTVEFKGEVLRRFPKLTKEMPPTYARKRRALVGRGGFLHKAQKPKKKIGLKKALEKYRRLRTGNPQVLQLPPDPPQKPLSESEPLPLQS
jgi:transposase